MAKQKSFTRGKNSKETTVQAIARAQEVLELPAGYKFKTEEEETLWAYFSTGRSLQDWDDGHRVVLYNLVKNQCRLNDLNERLDRDEPVIYNDRGNPSANPLFTIISTVERLIQSDMRLLGLQKTDSESATVKGRAKQAKDAKDTVKKVGALSLLASNG